MESIKNVKQEALKIINERHGQGYNYSADVRTEAMKVYALLTIAENMSQQHKQGDKSDDFSVFPL